VVVTSAYFELYPDRLRWTDETENPQNNSLEKVAGRCLPNVPPGRRFLPPSKTSKVVERIRPLGLVRRRRQCRLPGDHQSPWFGDQLRSDDLNSESRSRARIETGNSEKNASSAASICCGQEGSRFLNNF